MNKIPVIIDCDPGLDDAVALILAGRNEKIDIKGVTVVGGNQTLEIVGRNALRLLDLIGIDAPVAYGFGGPMVRELVMAPEVHGSDGIQGVVLPETDRRISKLHAIDLMAEILKASQEKITLITMGPLTNVGMLLKRFPELAEKIERISLMGGVLNGGNCTCSAEFNIYVDPEAASIVFNSGIPITMSGLDLTHKAILLPEEIQELRELDNEVAGVLVNLLDKITEFHHSIGDEFCYLHDPVALIAASHPEIIKTKALRVDIELQGEFTTGMTVANQNPRFNQYPNADVGLEIDRQAFAKIIKEIAMKYEQ
nr:nucleoside hydrolase [Tissierella sp.]